ncbi:hypothetical protein KCU71_g10964, partial [Aureobasidium melanogenum]
MLQSVVLENLFDQVCYGLSSCKFFDSHDAPSFFVVYAHDMRGNHGTLQTHDNLNVRKADGRIVRDLITYMQMIASKCRSDRGAMLNSDCPEAIKAKHDILENQFCLLPRCASPTSVDKVVLFYSEVMQDYCTKEEGRKYINTLAGAGLDELRELQWDGYAEPLVASRKVHSLKSRIKDVVERYKRETWFHYVLNEIGLVSLRTKWDKNSFTVIAVNLHNITAIADDLEFIGPTQHWLTYPSGLPIVINETERQHRLFFDLLGQIYEDQPNIVHVIRKHYDKGLESLGRYKQGPDALRDGRVDAIAVFNMTVQHEISEDIKRFGAYVPGRPPARDSRESPEQSNPGPIQWSLRSNDDQLEDLFLRLLADALTETHIWIVLDALDEAGSHEAREIIADLRFIVGSLEEVAKGLSICFTCRKYPVFTVNNGLEIQLEEANGPGITHYVKHELNEELLMRQVRVNYDFRNTISEKVANDCKGIFPYALDMVRHAIDLLQEHGEDSKIISEIRHPPQSFTSLYEEIIHTNIRNKENGLKITMVLFQVIQFSLKPMTVEELRCILISDKSFMELLPYSSADKSPDQLENEVAMTTMLESYLADLFELVDLENSRTGDIESVVKFKNYSIVEWVSASDQMAAVFHVPASSWVGQSHDRLARACYTFIRANYMDWSRYSSADLKGSLSEHYAIAYWFNHVEYADEAGQSQSYLKQELNGLEDDQKAKHTAAGIPTWSPTVVLICRSTAYVWQSGRDAQFS